MIRTILLGALAGGTIGWVWGAISWMLLPWHHATFLSFANEPDLARTMLDNCPRSGVYGLPAPPRYPPGADKATRAAIDRAAHTQMVEGPLVTAIVQRNGFGSVPMAMLRAFLIAAMAGALLTWLLLQTTGLSYVERVTFVAAIGLAVGLVSRLPDWNWHGYSTAFTIVCVADHVAGGFLVGLGIAALT